MSSPTIAVIGSANVDLVTFTDRFPKPGETIFAKNFDLGFGGKGANQAVAARLCGAEVLMVARIGNDPFGSATLENFDSFGIDTSNVEIIKHAPSGVASIFVDSLGENRILVVKGANDYLLPEDVDRMADFLTDVDYIILQFEIPLETVYHTIRLARARNIPCILNPAPAQEVDWDVAGVVQYFIPNKTEAEIVTGLKIDGLKDARSCARQLCQQGVSRVILTLGSEGALLASSETSEVIPSFPVETRDTTGAGDAFIGSLTVFLAEGLEEAQAIRRACLFAALSTTRVGTQKSFFTRSEFESEWERRIGV